MGILSKKSANVFNPIDEEDTLAEKLEKEGKQILKLSAGDPPKYFKTPEYIIEAYIRALKERKTSYALGIGVKELREAVAERYKRMYNIDVNEDNVIITQGVSEGIDFVNAALLDPGNKGILFRPYYPLYMIYMRENGGIPLFENYYEHLSWNVDVEKLEKTIKKEARRRPKYLLVTNPNNPTGTVLDRKVLEELVKLANEYDILIISDEIYDEIVFNNAKFTSIAELAKGVPHIILNGASKSYDATGFRLGYMLIPEQDEKSMLIRDKLADYAEARLSANVPAQYAFADSLNNTKAHEKAMKEMVKEIEERVNLATKIVNESKFMHAVEPKGAFYLFPKVYLEKMKFKNDKDFVISLLKEEGIQITRGSGFGAEGHVRLVALAPKNILTQTINKIIKFCERHKKEA